MRKLKFLRQFVGQSVLILGVAFEQDALFHRFQGHHQYLENHPLTMQTKLSQVKTRWSSAISLTELEYSHYVLDGAFHFEGVSLICGGFLVIHIKQTFNQFWFWLFKLLSFEIL